MSTARIARRNLGRNTIRTLIALGAIALAQAGVLLIDGFITGYGDAMVDAITGPMMGHVQVHAHEWRDERAMDLAVEDVQAALKDVRALPEVRHATARIYAPALFAVGEEGHMGMVVGLEPEHEGGATGLLGNSSADALKLEPGQALVGRGLAREIGLEVGDEVAVVGQAADGSIANDLYRVAGTVRSSVDLVHRSALIIRLDSAQELLVMPDQAHELTVHGTDPKQALAVREVVSALPRFADSEVMAWEQLAPELLQMIEMSDSTTWIMLVLVFVAAAAGVANTMLMATFERNHELGMLLALGCSPGRIVSMITLEAFMLGLLGVLVGTGLGVSANLLLAQGGINLMNLGDPQQLEDLSFAGMNYGMEIFPRTSLKSVLGGVAAVGMTSLLAALWPALHAARLQPVEAMRS